MKKVRRILFIALGLFWAYTSAAMPEFVEHIIQKNTGSWGKTGYGDFNNDGHLDFTAGPSGGAVYWYENPGDLSKEWPRHNNIDPKNGGCVGGEPADVDGDGVVDFISHGMWYRNSKETPGQKFEKFSFAGGKLPGAANGCHDLVAADIDGDGKMDAMNHGIAWWRNPGGEEATKTWEQTIISPVKDVWGTVAPRGWGDIDGDGDTDVMGIKDWYENVDGKGKTWKPHTYTEWGKRGKYGWEFRTVTGDFDGDGDVDLAFAEGDQGGGTAAWAQNVDGKGLEWKTMELPFGGIKGDMHSIGAQDFDLDGDLDIVVPKNGGGTGNEWSVFENDGKGNFTQHIVYKGYGGHESIFADFDKDGDVDMVSKCWCGGGALVLLENKLDPKPPGAPGGVSATVTAENKVEISWAPPAGFTAKLSYIIYRNDVALDTITEAKYLDSTAKAGEPNNYSISGVFGKMEGEKSAPQLVTSTYPMEKLKKLLSFSLLVSHTSESPMLEVVSNASGQFSIGLYDMQGARLAVISGQEEARGTIPLQGFKNGIYILRLTTLQGAVTEKFILSR